MGYMDGITITSLENGIDRLSSNFSQGGSLYTNIFAKALLSNLVREYSLLQKLHSFFRRHDCKILKFYIQIARSVFCEI